jgi:ssRNA-specific RNase YbeY (16S rRNA maturation enzyme)
VHELESALLSAHEKIDSEALASIHAEQDREMQALGISIRQDQWRDADWQIQALQLTKEASQTDLIYYNNLYQAGLINDEIQNLSLANNAMQTRTGANIVEAFAESFRIVPDFFVGAMSTFSQIPIGTKLAGLFETIAKIMMTVAEIQSSTAAIDMTQANWDRRSVEWFHHMQMLPLDIQRAELQILGAHRRRDQAMQELNNQQRQIEHATEVLDFLRDKFTSTDLYLKLKKETTAMHARMYKLAHCAALEAQRAFNFERGHTTRHFIPEASWDSLRGALVAGERLQCAIARMEKAYFDENVRERELTKHFSLRMHFPEKFLELKATGRCEIEVPEWMFDLDYPGQYMRRIRSVSLTIPCVTGPYTGVHCRMTLLSSITRIDPRLTPPASGCCCDCAPREGYEGCAHDPRLVHVYGAREAIATSSGQNDSGLFELNFHDERYLPFEFQGAISRWRIELPRKNNYIPMDTLTDLVMHFNYTSREGGEMLRQVAGKAAEKHLPGSGWVFFDVRYEFPDAWQLIENDCVDEHRKPRLALRLDRKMFPYIPGVDEIVIDKMALVFNAEPEHEEFCGCVGECNCPVQGKRAAHLVEFSQRDSLRRNGSHGVACVATDERPDLYYGVLDTHLGPIGRDRHRAEIEFEFPERTGCMERIFLLCRYRRWQHPC